MVVTVFLVVQGDLLTQHGRGEGKEGCTERKHMVIVSIGRKYWLLR